jgi:hypothetical protein
LDTVSVIAFSTPGTIVFPTVDEHEELRRPGELDQLIRDLSEVEDEFARVASFAIPTGVQPTR